MEKEPLTEDDIYGLLFDSEEWAQYEAAKLAVGDAIQDGQEEVALPTDLASGLFYADYFDLPPLLTAWNRICEERGATEFTKVRGGSNITGEHMQTGKKIAVRKKPLNYKTPDDNKDGEGGTL